MYTGEQQDDCVAHGSTSGGPLGAVLEAPVDMPIQDVQKRKNERFRVGEL